MRFGIQHGMGDPAWQPKILGHDAVIGFARAVEEAGFAHLAFTDHPAPSARWADRGGEGVADLFTALGFCAAATDRIGLLSWMLVLPYHNPIALAQRIATLDALSGGRITLGIGTGYLKSEFFALGVDFDRRRELFDVSHETLRRAFLGEDLSLEGPGFSARGVRIMPNSPTDPHPPFWIHGNGRFGIRRAARVGEGWVGMLTTEQLVGTVRTAALPDLDSFQSRIAELHQEMDRIGRARDEVELVATGVVPLLDERAPWNVEAYRERFAQLGELGITTIVVNACGDDPDVSLRSAQQFASDFIG
jgi:probable F420-dependent oxidoreductase